jgi:MSHA biogenesis protein MshP
VIAALVVLVMLAALASAVVRMSYSQQSGATQSLLATRANLAAGAGLEWGLYQALKGSWTACNNSSQTLDLRAENGMRVLVTCSLATYNEGETAPDVPRTVQLYRISALACNSATACPDNTQAARQGYVERQREAVVSR